MGRKYGYGQSYTFSSLPSALSQYLWVGGVRIGARGGLAKMMGNCSSVSAMPELESHFPALARGENCRYSDGSVLARLFPRQRMPL